MNQSDASAKYLYAFVQGALKQEPGEIGLGGTLAYAIENKGLAAIVSDVPNKRVRPERRNLAAYQAVLKSLLQESTPLPVSFGIVAENRQGVEIILNKYTDVLHEHFHLVQGKVEMGLRVTWDVPNIFEYFIDIRPELKAARGRFFGRHSGPSRDDKIELGRMFDGILQEERTEHTGYVRSVLLEYCEQIAENKCAKEADVMNLACLVERKGLDRFEEGVFQAAEHFNNNFAFDFNGPWAPHNFVRLELEL